MKKDSSLGKYRETLHEIIFEADTPAGKLFDIILIVSIVSLLQKQHRSTE
ncbi:MAG: hypothetical protein K8R09_00900 [Desulfobacterales bacterium]|nr:hypothetical protein [Desulfobacterales bacterium]